MGKPIATHRWYLVFVLRCMAGHIRRTSRCLVRRRCGHGRIDAVAALVTGAFLGAGGVDCHPTHLTLALVVGRSSYHTPSDLDYV